ncbi:MAG: hypothetical protein JJT78_11885 [Leptospira sp.]|nr:hypothetical protein [Leptospira sp.]
MIISFLKIISTALLILFFSGCDFIPFLGHDKEDRNDLNNLLILAIASNQQSGGGSGGSPGPCNGPGGGPAGRRGEEVVSQGGSDYGAGYSQVTSNRQDAYAYKKTGETFNWCNYYDRSPADTRGVIPAINSDGSELFVAFTTDGGNANFRATARAVQNSYGQGGGPKVTFLARINPENGEIRNATYLGARLGNGRTNSLTPTSITIASDRVTFIGETAFDRTNASDSLAESQDCGNGTRTVVMPLELTRDSPYSASCSNPVPDE